MHTLAGLGGVSRPLHVDADRRRRRSTSERRTAPLSFRCARPSRTRCIPMLPPRPTGLRPDQAQDLTQQYLVHVWKPDVSIVPSRRGEGPGLHPDLL